MRVLVVSDVHYDGIVYRGVDTNVAWKWLLRVVRLTKPDLLLGCGDLGRALKVADLDKLARRTMVLTISGNHDNVEVLRSAKNVLGTLKGKPILMEDGEVYEVGGLSVAGVNGVVVAKRDPHAPKSKKESEYVGVAKVILNKLGGKRLDVLLLHESPYYPELLPGIRESAGTLAAREVVERVRPRIVIGGHAHLEPQLAKLNDEIVIAHLDSSQLKRSYLIMEVEDKFLDVTLYKDGIALKNVRIER